MSAMVALTWQEFLKEAREFIEISERLEDTWSLRVENEDEGNAFLRYSHKIDLGDVEGNSELIQIEYHIVYSISYQVPVLYFQAHHSDGRLVSLENSWRIFRCDDVEGSPSKFTRSEMLTILTQMEHPVLFRPFLCLHPCRTAELLALAPASRNRIVTFISLMGPYVQLRLPNTYGLCFDDVLKAAGQQKTLE